MLKNVVKTVYVCSPLRGRNKDGEATARTIARNLDLAKRLCLAVVKAGHAPYAPHVFFPSIGLDDRNELQRAAGMAAGHAWLGMAAEVWVFARNMEECSEGMRLELLMAEKFSIPPKVVFMPKCWAEFESELPPPPPKLVAAPKTLKGEHLLPGEQA
jgi:hypothetical protein